MLTEMWWCLLAHLQYDSHLYSLFLRVNSVHLLEMIGGAFRGLVLR